MTLTTVSGRVRAAQRLKAGGAAAKVIATSWASDRAFPRTTGAAVPFELEAGDGAVYRVDPFEAFVALPVRHTALHDGVRREDAWIAVADAITVEGELERGGRGRLPSALRACRIAPTGAAPGALHRLPPRALQRGESEPMEVAATAVEADPSADATPDASPDAPPDATRAAEAGAPRRPKKKRPDSTGTPTPVSG